MIDCQTTRERLECFTAQERANDGEVASHLEGCSDCNRFSEHLLSGRAAQFDNKVASALRDVSIPAGLQDRLLAAIEEEQSAKANILPISSQKPTVNPRGSRWMRVAQRLIGGVAAVLLVAMIMVWSQPDDVPSLSYADAKSELSKQFEDIAPAAWDDLPEFDGSFPTSRLDSTIRGWELSEAVGVDLGQDAAHDVAAFHFEFKKWSGTLIVLQTEQFNGTPTRTSPGSSSGRQIVEWQSPDGKLTYLCFVDEGSAGQLVEAMSGNIG